MSTKNNKIIIVDDDPYILMSLEFLIKKNGFDVLVARNGTEAMQLLQEQVPSIIILDIMMPDVDGYQICAYIKQQKKLSQTKVVFLSAKSNEADVKKGLELGASLYITKPFSTRELVKSLKALHGEP